MKKVDKEIFRLTLPNVISNVSVPLLSTVDTILMGRLSISHLAAVGICSMIFNVLYWNFGFLRMATTGLTAQAFGSGSERRGVLALCRGLLLAFLIGVVLLLLQNPLRIALSYMFDVGVSESSFVNTYFDIRIWAAPVTLMLFVVFGWLFGRQNTVWPMIVTILINVINIGASYYLVKIVGYGVGGVAVGTVIAQYIGLLFGIGAVLSVNQFDLRTINLQELLNWSALKLYLKLNSDIFIRTICLTVAFVFFYSQSNRYGAVVMAANIILLQFVNWMSYVTDGFAFAAESLVGKYYGRSDFRGLSLVITRSMLWSMIIAVGFSVVFYFFGESLIRVFSKDSSAIIAAKRLLPYIYFFPIAAFASYIWDGVFVGLLAAKSMRDTMLLSLLMYFLSFALLPISVDGSHIWVAFLIFVFSRGVAQSVWYLRLGVRIS